MDRRSIPAIALGGIAGAAARWWVHGLWPDGSDWWATLIVNVAGSAVLGWLVATEGHRRRVVAAIVGAGFCGSFTTFSTFSLIVAGYLRSGRPWAGLLYAAMTLGAAVPVAVLAGWARRRIGRPERGMAA
jgi:CrcB protein